MCLMVLWEALRNHKIWSNQILKLSTYHHNSCPCLTYHTFYFSHVSSFWGKEPQWGKNYWKCVNNLSFTVFWVRAGGLNRRKATELSWHGRQAVKSLRFASHAKVECRISGESASVNQALDSKRERKFTFSDFFYLHMYLTHMFPRLDWNWKLNFGRY